jgi:hypothetical protein
MTDHYPPPGSPPPPGAGSSSGYGRPSRPGPWQVPPPPPQLAAQAARGGPERGMLGAAHKPGVMPLRPLGLGDIYDAAFRIIRFNPTATVGSAVLVAAIAMLVPILLTTVLTFAVGVTYDPASSSVDDEQLAGVLATYGALGAGAVLNSLGLIFVTGMLAHVTLAAAVGKRLTLGQAWAATRGARWRLVGLALLLAAATVALIAAYVLLWVVVVVTADLLLVVLWGIVSVPGFVVLLWFFWIRVYYFPVSALMLERTGVGGAVARGWRLTSRAFWRTLGIALLTWLITVIAGQVLAFPIGLIGSGGALAVGDDYALLVVVAAQALGQVVSTAFVAPFTAAVTTLQYLDQRMRKEAFDVELMSQAGVLGS